MKKNGFTLAEVLITLGIIGVVAAITLPILIQNYQKHVWVNQLKKSYSILSQGFNRIMSENDADYIFDTDVFESGKIWCLRELNSTECNQNIAQNILKYFKIQRVNIENDGHYLSKKGKDSLDYCWEFADGSLLGIEEFIPGDDDLNATAMTVFIDVNGLKNPNTYGRDIFYFDINGHGIVRPMKGSGCGEINEKVNLSVEDGYTCADRITQNGWKMDY